MAFGKIGIPSGKLRCRSEKMGYGLESWDAVRRSWDTVWKVEMAFGGFEMGFGGFDVGKLVNFLGFVTSPLAGAQTGSNSRRLFALLSQERGRNVTIFRRPHPRPSPERGDGEGCTKCLWRDATE